MKKHNGRLRFKAAKLQWKTRSASVHNRLLRKTRNYADRVQHAMNRSLVRVTNSYRHCWWVMKPIRLTEYSEPFWFCPHTGRPVTSRDATGRFVNPWMSQSTDGVKSISDVALWQWERLQRTVSQVGRRFFGASKDKNDSLEQTLAASPTDAMGAELSHSSARLFDKTLAVRHDQLQFTWIGHSTCLVQQGSITILTDPIFSTRCSPFQSLPVGVARAVPPGVSMADLPTTIDVCLISHDHYDHLDKDSVSALTARVQLWVVPLGIAEWLQQKCHISADRIVELEWWESVKLHRATLGAEWNVVARHSGIRDYQQEHPALADEDVLTCERIHDGTSSMWLTCCPAQHWSSRTFFDRNYRLWCSYTVFLPRSKFYFGGDTALPEHFPLFDQIRDHVGGNIDLAALSIGAYDPSFFMANSHMNPADAVKVHQALDVKRSIGIHWGTFALSEEPMDEPPVKLSDAAEQAKVDFTTIENGNAIVMDCPIVEKQTGKNSRC